MNELRQRFVRDVATVNAFCQVIVVAVKLPSGAIETIVNYQETLSKMQYYLNAYDDDFRLKSNRDIQIVGFLIV